MSEAPHCAACGKSAEELTEYAEEAREEGISPAEYVRREEGTYNPETNRFLCTPCYIQSGMPSSPGGWRAP